MVPGTAASSTGKQRGFVQGRHASGVWGDTAQPLFPCTKGMAARGEKETGLLGQGDSRGVRGQLWDALSGVRSAANHGARLPHGAEMGHGAAVRDWAVQSPHPLSQHMEHSRASRLWFTASQIWRALLFKYDA